MNITDYYDFSQGLAVISPNGLQKYMDRFQSFSPVFEDIYSSVNNNKHAMDSAWETGDIYYANCDTGYVRKIQYDCTELYSLKLTNPVCLSVVQGDLNMRRIITDPLRSDDGCWIADKGTGKAIKTDNNLNIIYEFSGIINPVDIAADVDGGCVIIDDTLRLVIKLSSEGLLLDSIGYDDLNPPISSVFSLCTYYKEIKPFKPHNLDNSESLSDSEDLSSSSSFEVPEGSMSSSSSSSSSYGDTGIRYWFMADERVYQLCYKNGNLVQTNVIYPLTDYSDYSLASIDVDLNDDNFHLYVGIGNNVEAVISKYHWNSELLLTKPLKGMGFPYILDVVKGWGSTCLYVLPDPAKWSDCVSFSSSSSSS